MPRPQVSVVKRQREQAKRERLQQKAARREQRKNEKQSGAAVEDEFELLTEPAPFEDDLDSSDKPAGEE